MIVDRKMDHEYPGIQGIQSFINNALKISYGDDSKLLKENRVAGAQTLSGTGSLRLGFDFLHNFYPNKSAAVYIPNPTWPIHKFIIEVSGFKHKPYQYYDKKTKGLNFEGVQKEINKAPKEQIFLFHVCAHNPTGVDPSMDQWKVLLESIKKKNHYVVFDNAYQGIVTGDLRKDAAVLDLFANNYDKILQC